MKNNPEKMMGRIRLEILKKQELPISLRDDIYPIALSLHSEMDGHKNSSPHSVMAAVRCTMQRLVKEKIFVRLRRGLYLYAPDKRVSMKGSKMSKPLFKTRDFTLDQVLGFQPYKGQRDSDKHADQWLNDPKFDPNNVTLGHTIVLASFMGTIYVMDGNTQLTLHRRGEIKLPNNLPGLGFYYCNSEAQLHDLYESFNSSRQTKQAGDQFFSALKLNNVKAKSGFFSRGSGTSGLAFAEGARRGLRARVGKLDHVATVYEWRSEIMKIDALIAGCKKPGATGVNAGVLAGQLLTFRKSPAKAAEFWKLFYENVGEGDSKNPWNRLYSVAGHTAANKGGGREATVEIIEITLSVFEHCADEVILSNDLGKIFKRSVKCHTYLPETVKAADAKAKLKAKTDIQQRRTKAAEEARDLL